MLAGHPRHLARSRRAGANARGCPRPGLEPDELGAVWRAAEALQSPIGQLIRLMTLTAARRGEVAAMRWQDVDLERRLWTIPKELNKAGRAHEVPLSDLAIEVLG